MEELMALVRSLIEEQLAPLRESIVDIKSAIVDISTILDQKAAGEHYHDDYANQAHVNRAEDALSDRIYRLERQVESVEYEVHDADRKAERAQSAADNAQRTADHAYRRG